MSVIPAPFAGPLRAGVLVLAAVCAGAAAAGQGGRWSDWLDLLNQFEPFWLGGALAALASWLMLGRQGRATPLLAGLGILICAMMMGPDLIAAGAKAGHIAPGARTFKVVSYNLWERNVAPAATTRWILDQDADVVVLAETPYEIYHDLHPHYPFRTTCSRRDRCATMIMSKVKPLAHGGLGDAGEPWTEMAWATYPAPDGPITIVGAHITRPYPPGLQGAQVRRMASQLAQLPKDRMIVAGDYNSTPWSFALRKQDKAFGLERRTHALFSWPTPNAHPLQLLRLPIPILPIDQVYAGKGWRTVSIVRGPKLGSDHFPVVATFTAGG